jgi:hypothetical protein
VSAPARRSPVARVLLAILLFQLGLGLLLIWGDLRGTLRLPSFGPATPNLSEPIRPGDQTRRYDPDRAPPPGRPMPASPLPERLTLTPLAAGAQVLLEGTIAAGDGARIVKQIEELPRRPEGVILNSPGGAVAEALELGRWLRAEGLGTALRAGDICYSACPYLLAGGVTRQVPEAGSVGVHQHYYGQSSLLPVFVAVEEIQRGQAAVMAYLDAMGIDPLVMRHAMETPPDEIYLLLPEELAAYGFVTPTE